MAETTPPPSTDVVAPADMGRGVVRGVSLDQRVQYARLLAESGLLPTAYRKAPANVLYAVEWGTMLGIHPMAAITGVHIIEGKPSASAALISALVRRAGHRLRVKVTGQADSLVATAQIIRHDDPDFTYEVSWDRRRATAAGLWGKGTWAKYPEAMLKARAISEVAREACEEALCGVHYTPEELGATVDIEGEVIERPAQQRQQAPAQQDQQPTHAAMPDDADQFADALHTAVYGARSRAELVLVLADLGVCDASMGSKGVHRAALEQVQVHDAQGTLVTGWELVRTVGATLPEATPAGPEPATREQLTAVNAAASRFGLTDREARLQWLSEWTEDQRSLTSSAELTKAEAHHLLDELARRAREERTPDDAVADVRDFGDVVDGELVADSTGEREPDGGAERREETTRPDPTRRHPAVAQAMGPVRANAARQAAQAEAARAATTAPATEEQQA